MSRRSHHRRTLTYVAMGALLTLSSLTLSQCTQVGDSLTGVSLSGAKRISCRKQCQEDFVALLRQENSLHKANIRACDRDEACIVAENARHRSVVSALATQIAGCKATCHTQGTVSAN